MSAPDTRLGVESGRRLSLWGWGGILTLVAAVATAVLALELYRGFRSGIGPVQPVPFSHRFHVSTKQLTCVFCHDGVISRARAGIPPLQTCMLCHQRVIVHYPQIEKLRQHFAAGRPLRWVRVTDLPEFVYFNHARHVRAGFDCGRCHGEVNKMDRLVLAHSFRMGFCIDCHRREGASHDCYMCHR